MAQDRESTNQQDQQQRDTHYQLIGSSSKINQNIESIDFTDRRVIRVKNGTLPFLVTDIQYAGCPEFWHAGRWLSNTPARPHYFWPHASDRCSESCNVDAARQAGRARMQSALEATFVTPACMNPSNIA